MTEKYNVTEALDHILDGDVGWGEKSGTWHELDAPIEEEVSEDNPE